MSVAMFPGSFDPITNGHISVVGRASKLFDRVIVCLMANSEKKNQMFTLEKRAELARKALSGIPNVEVVIAEGLFAEYAKKYDKPVIVKGIRTAADFEYECQIRYVNKRVNPELETVFLASEPEYMYVSSTAVRELLRYGASIKGLVPDEIIPDLEK